MFSWDCPTNFRAMHPPLNALRAFEASARHLSFTRAADEMNLSQTAVSAQVKNLEARLGVTLFRRLPRGLALTDEGQALLPQVTEAMSRITGVLEQLLDRASHGRVREAVTVAAVGTYAIGWLLPRLPAFEARHPEVDLRLSTHNNRVDLATEGLDFAIRFGAGAWHGVEAEQLLQAPLSVVCSPGVAARLSVPADLARVKLLRSFRVDEWRQWFDAARCPLPLTMRGPVFDSSLALAAAAQLGAGAALLPVALFDEALRSGRLVQPFPVCIDGGRYWLTRLQSRQPTAAMRAFRDWLLAQG